MKNCFEPVEYVGGHLYPFGSRNPHHLKIHNLKTMIRYNPYAHMVDYLVLVDPKQVPTKHAFDQSKCFGYKYYVYGKKCSIEVLLGKVLLRLGLRPPTY